MKNLLFLIAIILFSPSLAADKKSDTEKEISHLLEYLENSKCEFNRNGSWYNPYDAVKHIEKKYRYLKKKGLINSAEQFIDRAASESSISGSFYLVRCGDSRPVRSSIWFTDELKKFREAHH